MNKSITYKYLKYSVPFLLVVTYISGGTYISFQALRILTGAIMLAISSYLTVKFYKRYFPLYAATMFNSKPLEFNKHIDKPRIFIYSLFWPIVIISMIWFMAHEQNSSIWIETLLKSVKLGFFLIASWICNLTWNRDFESKYIPKIKGRLKVESQDFKCEYSNEQLETIFNGMTHFGYLEYETSEERLVKRQLFVKTFRDERLPDSPPFDLNLPVIDAVAFFTQLRLKINGLTNPKLSKIFLIKEKPIKPNSIKNSKYNAGQSRGQSEIEHNIEGIFSKIH